MTRLPFVLLFATSLAFADSWSGYLVDSDCYTNHERGAGIDRCQPTSKTTRFTVVNHNGQSFKLDHSGNTQAARLVGERHVDGRLEVTVTGRKSGETVIADSIQAIQ